MEDLLKIKGEKDIFLRSLEHKDKRKKGSIYFIVARYHVLIVTFVVVIIILIELICYRIYGCRFMFVYVLAYLLGAFVSIVTVSHSIKRYLYMVQEAILEQSNPERIIVEEYEGPDELIEIIDNLNEMKNRMEEAKRETKRIEESKSRLMADISHDLVSPINVINGYLKLYKEGILPETKIAYVFDMVERKNKEMVEMIERLHEYNVVNHPEFPMQLSILNFSEFTKNYFEEQKLELDVLEMSLTIEVEENIYCHLDSYLIQRMYSNLLCNVIKYNEKGTKILVNMYQEDDKAVVKFSDTGRGIDRCIKEQLFHPFVKKADKECKSTGLGMAIVQKIVHEHGGKIYLDEGKEESGTNYIIVLPCLGKTKFNITN